MKLASGICKVPLMLKLGVPVGLAVDGCGSNDASNLLSDLRTTFLLHRLNSSRQAPSGYEILKLGTVGSAEILGRIDIGRLEEGKAADLFLIDVDKLETVGSLLDPASYLCTVGYGNQVHTTVINGKVVFAGGRLLGIDEEAVKNAARKKVKKVYENLPR
jgi:cytosine/adenosine deaminase-related metal-dependent hydrolase